MPLGAKCCIELLIAARFTVFINTCPATACSRLQKSKLQANLAVRMLNGTNTMQ